MLNSAVVDSPSKLSDGSGAAAIRLRKIGKRFGGSTGPAALNELDLDIHDKELLVLLGPSGCGKTTTLNILAGLE
jgi:ABC-type sugar transport system ATPase subunit